MKIAVKINLLFLSLLTWVACALTAQAQLTVTLEIGRTMYLVDEPLKATLHIKNLAGRDIILEDTPTDGPWCMFQIKAVRGGYISSRKPNLSFPPVELQAGETISRTIDIAELYDINEPSQLRIRACITFPPTHKQFWSEPAVVTTDTGKLLWNQTVGIPDGRAAAGAYRTFSLITHQRVDGVFLFAKLEGKEEGIRFATYPLGRVLAAMQPQAQLDDNNNLYIFHAANDTAYTLTQIDVATGQIGQAAYKSSSAARQGRPTMRRSRDGQLVISGGVQITTSEIAAEPPPGKARLSDRPAGF